MAPDNEQSEIRLAAEYITYEEDNEGLTPKCTVGAAPVERGEVLDDELYEFYLYPASWQVTDDELRVHSVLVRPNPEGGVNGTTAGVATTTWESLEGGDIPIEILDELKYLIEKVFL